MKKLQKPIYLDVPELIRKELDKTIPFIHPEGENDFVLIQVTESGIWHLKERVNSIELAREKVDAFIARIKKNQSVAANPD